MTVQIEASKLNTYNVLASSNISASKIVSYNVLAQPSTPPATPFGVRTPWLAVLKAQQAADEDTIAGIRSRALCNRTIPISLLVLADRVMETTITTGTGSVLCSGPVKQYQSFNAIGVGNFTYYCVLSGDGVNWEVGVGIIAQLNPTIINRSSVLSSSNGGNLISLTGTSNIFCDLPASKATHT